MLHSVISPTIPPHLVDSPPPPWWLTVAVLPLALLLAAGALIVLAVTDALQRRACRRHSESITSSCLVLDECDARSDRALYDALMSWPQEHAQHRMNQR